MKFKFFVAAVLIGATNISIGQNLVENGSFEEVTKKPKNEGEIFLAPPWVAGTKAQPDLYSSSAKNDMIRVPDNAYGDEEPKEGDNYAGILVYSDREKEARSYLTARLKYPMLAGEHYCVKFHISFADLSKYASNNIGCLISKDSIGSETELILKYTPQIINSTNRIFEKQWSWEDICRIYVAEGGEQYITIGNFAPQASVLTKPVKRPPGYTTTQFRDGYYYIDDVSVLPNATPENCKCEPGNFAFANLNKEQTEFSTDEEDIPEKVFISTTGEVTGGNVPGENMIHQDEVIQFQLGKSALTDKESGRLDTIAQFMVENLYVKLTIIGHNDATEKVGGLSQSRASQVSKYLVSRAVEENRIEIVDARDARPMKGASKDATKNMVVEIVFHK